MDFIRGAIRQLYDWCLQGVAFVRQHVFGLPVWEPVPLVDREEQEEEVPYHVPPEDERWRLYFHEERRSRRLEAIVDDLDGHLAEIRLHNERLEAEVARRNAEDELLNSE